MTHTILTFIFTEIHVHACPQTCALCRNILLNRMDTQHACVLYRRPVICAGADGRRSEYSTSHFQNVLNFRFNLRDYTDAICDSLVLFFFLLFVRAWVHCAPFEDRSILMRTLPPVLSIHSGSRIIPFAHSQTIMQVLISLAHLFPLFCRPLCLKERSRTLDAAMLCAMYHWSRIDVTDCGGTAQARSYPNTRTHAPNHPGGERWYLHVSPFS